MNRMTMSEIRVAIKDKATSLGLNCTNYGCCNIRVGSRDIARFDIAAATPKRFEITIDVHSNKLSEEAKQRVTSVGTIVERFSRYQWGIDDLFKFLASVYADKILSRMLNGQPIGDPIPLPLVKELVVSSRTYHVAECGKIDVVGVVAISGNKVTVGSDVIMTPGQKTWVLIAIHRGAIITDGEAWYSAAQTAYGSDDYLIINENIFNFQFTGWDTEIIHYVVNSYLGASDGSKN
jgi:hypothetical protein